MADKMKQRGPSVNNKKVVRRVAFKTIKANPRKNIVVIMAIALCTFMFASLFTVGMSLISKLRESTERQMGGCTDAGYKYLTEREYELIASDPKLKEVSKRIYIGDAVNPELIKLHTEVNCCDEINAEKSFSYPEVGHLPSKESEVVVSSLILQAFGMKADSVSDYEELIGEKIALQILGKGEGVKQEFEISGIYTGDRIANAQLILVSKEFQEKYAPTPTQSYYEEGAERTIENMIGRINADVDFYSPFDLEGQAYSVINRVGLPENVEVGVSWASAAGSMDLGSALVMIILLMTIFVSGYLIISNIYRINVYTDIRSYGLLKTIGTSSRQLKTLVKWQGIFHSIPGISLGLIGGILVGSMILPMIMSHMNFAETVDGRVTLDLRILLFSALFAYGTVRISIGKAIRFASKVTPMEALRYCENAGFKKKNGTGYRSFEPLRFAVRNVFRERNRCFFVVLSLALSMVVLNSIYTTLNGFDVNKYVEKFIATDFSISDATTDNLSVSENVYDGVTNSFLAEFQKQEGIVDMGNIYVEEYSFQYLNDRDYKRFKERLLDNNKVDTWMRDGLSFSDESGSGLPETGTVAKVYGMDDYVLRNIPVLHGTFDEEKFRSGSYILVNEYDTGGDARDEFVPYFMPGEIISVNNSDGEVRDYEVMATVEIPYAMRIQSYMDMDVGYILPSKEFLDFFGDRGPMRTLVDATDEAEPVIERWLSDYTENVERSLTYTSRDVYKKEFAGFVGVYTVVGGVITAVLALIGILNLINTLISSILSRKLEFAMLEAVGMTKKIQRKVICLEGVIYGGLAAVLGLILSTVFSLIPIKALCREMWFATYKFTILPVAVMIPVMILIAVIIPDIIYKSTMKETVVERLRLADA